MRNPFAKRPLPYGDPGSNEYWMEALKRAYQLGEERAKDAMEELAAETGPHPPKDFVYFPPWFWNLWTEHLSPIAERKFNHLRMPY